LIVNEVRLAASRNNQEQVHQLLDCIRNKSMTPEA
jgi:hypothetical protein